MGDFDYFCGLNHGRRANRMAVGVVLTL